MPKPMLLSELIEQLQCLQHFYNKDILVCSDIDGTPIYEPVFTINAEGEIIVLIH